MDQEFSVKKQDFTIVKEKIVKIDELLKLYKDKNEKLSKVMQAFKNLKSKFEITSHEVMTLKINNERLTENLNNITTKYNQNNTELNSLKFDYGKIEEKYQQTMIECQLIKSDLDEQVKKCSCDKNFDMDQVKKYKELKAQYKDLLKKNEALFIGQELKAVQHFEKYQIELQKTVGLLKESHKNELDALKLQMTILHADKNKLINLKKENDDLKNQIKKTELKTSDVQTQTEADLKIHKQVADKETQKFPDFELDEPFSIEDIFVETKNQLKFLSPIPESPTPFMPDILKPVLEEIDPMSINPLPNIIITPPTPNLCDHNKLDDSSNIDSNLHKENENLESNINLTNDLPILVDNSSITDTNLHKQADTPSETIPLNLAEIKRKQMERRRKFWIPNNVFNVPKKTVKKIVKIKKKSGDTILQALETLRENNIKFTISNENLAINPSINKAEIIFASHLECFNLQCMKVNSLMMLRQNFNEKEPELLGFATESPKIPPEPEKNYFKALVDQLINGIKNIATEKDSKNRRKKQFRQKSINNADDFTSGTESELERLFKRSSDILERNRQLVAAAKKQQEFDSGLVTASPKHDTDSLGFYSLNSTPIIPEISPSNDIDNEPIEEPNLEAYLKFPSMLSPFKGSPPVQNTTFIGTINSNLCQEIKFELDKKSGDERSDVLDSKNKAISRTTPLKRKLENVKEVVPKKRQDVKHESPLLQKTPRRSRRLNSLVSTENKTSSKTGIFRKNEPKCSNTSKKKKTKASKSNEAEGATCCSEEHLKDEILIKLDQSEIAKSDNKYQNNAKTKDSDSDKLKNAALTHENLLFGDISDIDGNIQICDSNSSFVNNVGTVNLNLCQEISFKHPKTSDDDKSNMDYSIQTADLNLTESNIHLSLLEDSDLTETEDNEFKRIQTSKLNENDTKQPLRRSLRINSSVSTPDFEEKAFQKLQPESCLLTSDVQKCLKETCIIKSNLKESPILTAKQTNFNELTSHVEDEASRTEKSPDLYKNNVCEIPLKRIEHKRLVKDSDLNAAVSQANSLFKDTSVIGGKKETLKTNKINIQHICIRKRQINQKKSKIDIKNVTKSSGDVLGDLLKAMSQTRPTKRIVNEAKPKPKLIKEAKDDDYDDGPKSPELTEVPDRLPKIIPLEKPKQLPTSKVKYLLNKLIMFSQRENILDEMLMAFAGQDINYMAWIVLNKLSTDIYNKPKMTPNPNCPPMTEVQQVLLGFLCVLEKSTHPGVLDKFLDLAERRVYDKNAKQIILEPITRVYTAVCKMRHDLFRIRRYVCDIFYFKDEISVPILYVVLRMYPQVLPLHSEVSSYPLAKVIVQICHLKQCNKPGYNLLNLKDLLATYYGYPTDRWNCDEIFNELFQEYQNNPSQKLYEYPLQLFLKNKPDKWVYGKINECFKPLYDAIPKTNGNLKASLIIFLGRVCWSFVQKGEEHLVEMRKWFTGLLEDETDPIVQQSVQFIYPKLLKSRKKKKPQQKPDNSTNLSMNNLHLEVNTVNNCSSESILTPSNDKGFDCGNVNINSETNEASSDLELEF